MQTLERQVIHSFDDCARRYHLSQFTVMDFRFFAGYDSSTRRDWGSAARFRDIQVPLNAILVSARLRLTCRSSGTLSTVNTRIRCQAADDPLMFSSEADFDGRTWTAARVNWDDIPIWSAGTEYESPDFAACVREVFARPGWAPGNSLVVLWDDWEERSTASINRLRQAESFDGDPALAPVLILQYVVPELPRRFDRFGRPKVSEAFGGGAVCRVEVAVTDDARPVTLIPMKLRHAAIQVQDHPQFLGDASGQELLLNVGDTVELRNIDLNTLYARNASAGDNGMVIVFGSRED